MTQGFEAEGVEGGSEQQAAMAALDLSEDAGVVVHMTHLNHLDLTWYWRLPDTIEMCLETIRWTCELLEAHPDMRYSHTQALILRVVEAVDPVLFERFKRLVEAGHAGLDSGQLVEPDHNIPTGESLARQYLYGQGYLETRFGSRASVAVNSDSFGHPRSLPQVLRLAGLDAFLFKRPRQKHVALCETPFDWVGLDGTRVTALRFVNKGAGLPSLSQGYAFSEEADELRIKLDANRAVGIRQLFGSHCRSDSGGISAYVAPFDGPGYEVRYSLPADFFAAVRAEVARLPVYDGLLNPVYEGCYTTHIAEKENCRRAERELRELEWLGSLAASVGVPYPLAALRDLGWRLAFLQFHDVLPGTGSPEAHADSAALYHELFLSACVLRRRVQVAVEARGAVREAVRRFVLANPRPFAETGIVVLDVEMPLDRTGGRADSLPLIGALQSPSGERVPYQITGVRTCQRYVRGTMQLVSPPLPPSGMVELAWSVEGSPVTDLSVDGSVLENEALRVDVGGPGIVRALAVKAEQEREVLRDTPAPVRLELWPETDYPGDYGSDMKAWMLGTTDECFGPELVGNVEVVETGPVRATLRIRHRWRESLFTTDVSLYAGMPFVDLECNIDWHEKEVLARLAVEPALTGDVTRCYGIPFGAEMATGCEREVPSVGWIDLSGAGCGMAVLNRDRPGACFRDKSLRVSLVRCATGDFDPCTDRGRISATLRLVPHAGSAADAQIPTLAHRFMFPPMGWQAEPAPAHAGALPEGPTVTGRDGVVLSCFKVTERGDGYVVRLFESQGAPGRATLTLPPGMGVTAAAIGNILEDSLEAAAFDGHVVPLDFRPYEIKTVLLTAPVALDSRATTGQLFNGVSTPPLCASGESLAKIARKET